jgi:hypothetical protein
MCHVVGARMKEQQPNVTIAVVTMDLEDNLNLVNSYGDRPTH